MLERDSAAAQGVSQGLVNLSNNVKSFNEDWTLVHQTIALQFDLGKPDTDLEQEIKELENTLSQYVLVVFLRTYHLCNVTWDRLERKVRYPS